MNLRISYNNNNCLIRDEPQVKVGVANISSLRAAKIDIMRHIYTVCCILQIVLIRCAGKPVWTVAIPRHIFHLVTWYLAPRSMWLESTLQWSSTSHMQASGGYCIPMAAACSILHMHLTLADSTTASLALRLTIQLYCYSYTFSVLLKAVSLSMQLKIITAANFT